MINKRICSTCTKPMTSGYVIHDGKEYFCSDECMNGRYSMERYAHLFVAGEAYWTEWEDEQ